MGAQDCQPNLEAKSIQPMTDAEMDNYRLHRRFDRMGRLIGDRGMKKLMDCHVMVVGIGGVGSFAAETLARSGVGTLTLVDFDEVCITNFNRQLHALQGTVGKKKATVMAERLTAINPNLNVRVKSMFYKEESAPEIFDESPHLVIDAIDSVGSKCHLLYFCHQNQIPVISCTGSGGRIDPTSIKVADLAQTEMDPLSKSVRKILRDKYNFPDKGPWGITAVYSTEPYRTPEDLTYDNGKGFRCVCPQANNPYFQCENRNLILGNASFVTGTFGLFAAAEATKILLA